MIIGIGYHYVRPSFELPHPGIFGLTPTEFKAQLELLGRHGEFVGQGELRRALAGKASLPERAWLVSFDDGLREQYEHALPVLDDLGIPAVFFVNTLPLAEQRPVLVHMTHLLRANVAPPALKNTIGEVATELGIPLQEVDSARAVQQYGYDTLEVAELKYLLNFSLPVTDRDRVVEQCFDRLLGWDRAEVSAALYMDREQIRKLAARDLLGSHSHSHRPLGTLEEADIRREILLSLDYLENWTGVRVDSLGYPYGSQSACTPAVGRVAGELGIRLGFTMERAGIDDHSMPLFLPRCAPNDLPGGSAARWTAERIFEDIPSSTWYAGEPCDEQLPMTQSA